MASKLREVIWQELFSYLARLHQPFSHAEELQPGSRAWSRQHWQEKSVWSRFEALLGTTALGRCSSDLLSARLCAGAVTSELSGTMTVSAGVILSLGDWVWMLAGDPLLCEKRNAVRMFKVRRVRRTGILGG